MKIYITNLGVEYDHALKLGGYLCNKRVSKTLYTSQGIYRVLRSKLMKLKIIDKKCVHTAIDGADVIIDNSEIMADEENYQLPVAYHTETITEYNYELRKNATVKLVIQTTDNETIHDVYFTSKEGIGTVGIKEDIRTFLSLLNFNKSI